jgi:hypothetical protein
MKAISSVVQFINISNKWSPEDQWNVLRTPVWNTRCSLILPGWVFQFRYCVKFSFHICQVHFERQNVRSPARSSLAISWPALRVKALIRQWNFFAAVAYCFILDLMPVQIILVIVIYSTTTLWWSTSHCSMWPIECGLSSASVWSPPTSTVYVMWCRKAAIVCVIYEAYELWWYSELQRGSFLSSVCFDDLLHCWFIALSAGSWCYESFCRVFYQVYSLFMCNTLCMSMPTPTLD